MYLVRRRIDLQYHDKRCHVHHVRRGLRSRNYLSVYCLYGEHKPGVYDLYCLRSGNTSKHNLYCLSQYRVYRLRRWVDL